jgi:hypothetical protein
VLDTTLLKRTQLTQIRHEPYYKQLEVKTNRTSFLCLNRNRHHNTELGTQRHIYNRTTQKLKQLEMWVTSMSDTPRLQYYDVQTLEYRYISKLPMKKERIWSNVKETTSHLQNKLIKNIHQGVATRSSTKWDCLKPIRFHQYTVYMRITTFPNFCTRGYRSHQMLLIQNWLFILE